MKHTMKAMPVSRAVLRGIAIDLRRLCRINTPYFPVDYVLELVPEIIPGYKVVIETIEKMGNNHGLTLYAEKIIKIREDVYEGACACLSLTSTARTGLCRMAESSGPATMALKPGGFRCTKKMY